MAGELHSPTDKSYEDQFRIVGERMLAAAKNGGRREAFYMVKLVAEALADGARIPRQIAEWIGPALYDMGKGESIEDALRIPRRNRGAGKEGAVEAERTRGWAMAYHVGHLLAEKTCSTLDAAAAIVADAHDCDDSTVKKSYRERKEQVEQDFALERKYFGKIIPRGGA